ncbi:5756_t:CDS:2 [Funneliformis mosseae]|uniref:5756_t:CDS:1 n=1 Tax=Funneliformis mosseae TaxID=27381 RepID=A0A9N9ATU0_FUNMO|nr:5756_t:CDS:2 [Funneliformis mosseae]
MSRHHHPNFGGLTSAENWRQRLFESFHHPFLWNSMKDQKRCGESSGQSGLGNGKMYINVTISYIDRPSPSPR